MPAKLLVADDSVTIQRVIELTFADEDVEVVAVGDGQQAIDRIERDRPDVILADVSMPERDGYDVVSFVKRSPHLSHIPVLLLTGAFEPVDEARSRAVGCDGVLAKPFEPQMVIHRVRDLLAKRASRGAATTTAPAPQPVGVTAPGGATGLEAVAGVARGPSVPAPRDPGEALDDYFDRLDAAFSKLRGPESLGSPERLDEPLDVQRSVRIEEPGPTRPAAPPASVVEGVASPVPVPPEDETLADAFAALLAAEQGQPAPPPAAPRIEPARSDPASAEEELVERVARRVIERLSAGLSRDLVTDVVLGVADRLVRQEIERIKAGVD